MLHEARVFWIADFDFRDREGVEQPWGALTFDLGHAAILPALAVGSPVGSEISWNEFWACGRVQIRGERVRSG